MQVNITNTRRSDVVARYGDEEFALLLPNCDERESLAVVERIAAQVGNLHFNTGTVTGSPERPAETRAYPLARLWLKENFLILMSVKGGVLMDYRFFTADVFTKQKFAGNQLAVFPAADELAGETMQLIAKEFNLSETVFVLPPVRAGGTKRLRIFTPGAEVPFAGHPTVGTAAVLAVTGDLGGAGELNVIFEEGIGDVPVRIERRQGGIFAMLSAAQMPEVRATDLTPRELASLVSLKEEDLAVNGYQPLAASCGLPFTFIPVASLEALKQASLDKPGWQKSLAPGWAPQVYLFVPLEEGSKFRARMFAPALGIEEDPATGAAATAFAGYIDQIHKYSDGTVRVVIEQGVEIKRPSTIYVEFVKTKGEISAIRVGGYTVPVSQGLITI